MTELRRPGRLYDGYILDLDGTVYLGDALLPGAGETVTALQAAGKRIIFLSNNPTITCQEAAARLTNLGLPTSPESVINSTQVLIGFLIRVLPEARLYVIGEAPLLTALEEAGFILCDNPEAIDAVIASFDRTFDYRKLQTAFDAIRAGARFFATNGDRYCPVPGGGQPDAAAIIAAIEACTGVPVEAILGKPSLHMAAAALVALQLPPNRCLMTGDRLETDVLLGLNAGMETALILTGATTAAMAAASSIRPIYVLRSLEELIPQGREQ